MPELHILLAYVSIGMQSLATLVGGVHWRRLSAPQRWLLVLLILSLITQLIARELAHSIQNNYPLFHAYLLIEFSFLVIIYRIHLEPILSRAVMVSLFIAFTLFALIDPWLLQSIWDFPSYTRTVETIIVIGFCVLYFVQTLRKLQVESIQRTFMFWVSTGLLIYFVSNLLVTLFGNMLATAADPKAWNAIWSVHNMLNILLYLSFGIAYLCKDILPPKPTA